MHSSRHSTMSRIITQLWQNDPILTVENPDIMQTKLNMQVHLFQFYVEFYWEALHATVPKETKG